MAKQQTMIHRFWHRVLYTPTKLAIVADRKELKGDLHVPYICPCVTAAYWASASVTPYIYAHVPACKCEAPVSYLSWNYFGKNVAELMAHLEANGFKKGDRAAIISDNRREWIEADMAIQSLGGITVPIFAHTTTEQISHIIDNSGATFAFVENKRQLTKIADKELTKIVIESDFKDIYAQGKSAEVLTKIAGDLKTRKGVAGLTHDDIATLIYTSGTTGLPKGVIITHGNIAYNLVNVARHGYKWREDDLLLAALPLAHIYGLTGLYLALTEGIPFAVCRITETGQALPLYQPTISMGVPKLWRKMRDAIEVELMKASGTKARIIKWAFRGQKRGPARWLADMLVFSKIRNRLGGRIRIAMSGGAALSADVQEFFAKIGIKLCQGYGMTETTGAIAAGLPENQDIGSSGRIFDFMDVAIMPHDGVPKDLGADTWGPLVKNKKNKSQCPETQAGEIWIKGPQIFKGYWNNPEATAKVFTEDGWFKTGDAGVVYNGNFLCVTGRVTRVIKNENGKWIPVDLIEEAVYTADQEDQFSVIQIIVPIAGSEYRFTGALVFIDPVEARLLLEHHGITPPIAELEGDPCASYARHPLIKEKVVEAIANANKKLQLWERIKRIQIVDEEATVDGGHLTPTLKVKTEAIRRKHKGLEQSIYASDATEYPEPIDII